MNEPLTQEELSQREAAAIHAFLGPEETPVAGITLRPVTLASLTLLKITKNEFTEPRGPLKLNPKSGLEEPSIENELLAALAFAYIHAGPEAEVRRAVWSESFFREKVLEFGDKFTPADLPRLIAAIEFRMAEIATLKFSVEPKPAEKDEGPQPPPN